MIYQLCLLLVAAAAASACNEACPMNYVPVCGSDGQTYGNTCEMESLSCLKKTAVAVAYDGECNQECNIACPMSWSPVCGSDAHTYGNTCEMESSNCLQKSAVAVAHQGECVDARDECNVACQMSYVPVCGTDGQTYGNKCELESTACLRKAELFVQYNGECGEPIGIPAEVECNEACLRNWEPVCGSDGITYGNLCQMQSLACTKRLNLIVSHAGEC